MAITQEHALEILQKLIEELHRLKTSRAFSAEHSRWLSNTLSTTSEIFGSQSITHLSIAKLSWHRVGSFIVDYPYDEESEKIHHEAYLKQLDTAKGLLEAGIDQIKEYGIEGIYKSKNTEEESSEIIKLLDLADNKLRKTIRETPSSEKEVQDKYENLLIATGINYLREQEKIVYSSKTYHPDFSFKRIKTVLEIKFCDKKSREKEIIAEINDDILAYKTEYPNIIFIVYDLGFIRDIDKFKDDIESEDAIIVKVVKH